MFKPLFETKQSKMSLRINTSNENKFKEFQRMFEKFNIQLDRTSKDVREIVSDPISVLVNKACQNGYDVVVEDTTLMVEGEDVGINIRWLMDELPKFKGKKAVWTVLLGVLKKEDNKVHIYEGIINGIIVEKRGESNFGFDPYFQPDGADKSLAEDKPDERSARFKAIENLAKNQVKYIKDGIFEWNGKWQNE